MDEKYWDDMADEYDVEILDSLNTDRRGVIGKYMDRFADANGVVADFGCGVGKYLGELASRFKQVYAIDYSARLLDKAKSNFQEYSNITYCKRDLSTPAPAPGSKGSSASENRGGGVDLVLCMNVLIAPGEKKCVGILRNINSWLKDGGGLMVVVPSMESALYANQQLYQWNMRSGISSRQAIRSGLKTSGDAGVALLEGVIPIEDVETKHYLQVEGKSLLAECGFELIAAEKVEYPWETEFEDPPGWMGEPYPWDWLFVAKKKAV